jgi:guanylate kinase
MKKHTMFLLVGESSSGKDSISNLLEQNGYKVLKSYATRPKREEEGNTHVFIKPEEVENYKKDIVAYTKIGQCEYFSTKKQLLENDIYIIDPNGIYYLKEKIKNIKFVTIYINVNENTRRERARKRGDKEEVMIKRFVDELDRFQTFKKNAEFNYAIENVDIDKSYDILKYIIERELKDE